MKNYRKKIKRSNLYKEYAKILNGEMDLSPRELEILSILLKIDTEWHPILEHDHKDILSTDNRRRIMREAIVNKNNLSKYISELKDKRYLYLNKDNGWEIAPLLALPEIVNNILEVTFTLEYD